MKSYEIDEKSGSVTEYELTHWQKEIIKMNKLADLYPENRSAAFTGPIYTEFVKKTLDELQDLIKRKQADYTNGAGPFANFDQAQDYGVDPFLGLMLRMGDKVQRIKSYCKQGELQVKDEGIEDAFKDLIGYSLIALAMLDEKKRGAR